MANNKALQRQIGSIGNTRKITKAMEMVAASKMRKAQENMFKGRPYNSSLNKIIGHLSTANPEYSHTYMHQRQIQKIAIILVSTDRGLCGGLNINLFKLVAQKILSCQKQGINVKLCTLGSKALSFARKTGCEILASTTHLNNDHSVQDIIGTVGSALDAYNNNTIDGINLAYNSFVNTMSQQGTMDDILPISSENNQHPKNTWDYLYEPNAKYIIDKIMQRYIEAILYQAVAENNACEQAARMMAMKNASENAADLADKLKLIYNKNRQAAITQEIAEIVGGAAALA